MHAALEAVRPIELAEIRLRNLGIDRDRDHVRAAVSLALESARAFAVATVVSSAMRASCADLSEVIGKRKAQVA